MTTIGSKTTYFTRLWNALRGREPAPSSGLEGDAALRSHLASLEMDLQERDKRIEAMKTEYAQLEAAKERATSGAGREELGNLFKRLAGPMSNIAALLSYARSGREVDVADLIKLFESFEKVLGRSGMEKVGVVGETVCFDASLHQRMSGGSVHAGSPVIIHVPGYRMEEKILLKAMVASKERENGTGRG